MMNVAFGIFYMVLCVMNLNTARVFADSDHPVAAATMSVLALAMGFIAGLYFGGVL